jgi:histidine phosphotransferase ChpT
MLDNKSDIATIISSRICHDLISPIGAISNGLELLELSGMSQSPEIRLIAESAKNANARIRFLRLAFGSIDKGAIVSMAEVLDILADYYNSPHIKINWAINTDLARDDLRILFLLLLCAEKITPYETVISIAEYNNVYEILTTGEVLKTEDFLDFETQKLRPQDSPSLVQFTFAQAQLDHLQYSLELKQTDNHLSIKILT